VERGRKGGGPREVGRGGGRKKGDKKETRGEKKINENTKEEK